MTKKRIIGISVLVLVILLVCGTIIFGSRFNLYLFPPSPKQYVADAVQKMDNGIYATGDEWAKARADALERAKTIDAYEAAYPILEDALFVAGGKHSEIVSKEVQDEDVAKQEMPTISLNQNGILILKLPAYTPISGIGQEYADTVIQFIQEHRDQIQAVILDIRDNTGGDMGPMIAAVSSFLPDGDVMYFNTRGNKSPVSLTDGQVTGGGSSVKVENVKLEGIPVAILQNELTASSGETILLAFRGLENVKTFGKPSAGYCSCNTVFFLYDGAMMQLTVGTDVARTGEEFCDDPILPDVESENPEQDAMEWLER